MRSAARRLFQERGFEDTRVEDIAAAASVVKATFFNYWGSKNALLADMLEELDAALAAALARLEPLQPRRSFQTLSREAEMMLAPYARLGPVLAVEVASHPRFRRLGLRPSPSDPTGFGGFTAKLTWDDISYPFDREAMAQVMADIWCAVLMDWLREPGSSFARRCETDLEGLRKLVFREA